MLIQDEFGKSGNYFDCAHFLTFVPLLDFWHFVIAVIFDHYLESGKGIIDSVTRFQSLLPQ